MLVNGWACRHPCSFRGIRVLSGGGWPGRRPGRDARPRAGAEPQKENRRHIDVSGEKFQVVGVFESDSLFENGGLIVPIKDLQRMMGREGSVSGFVVSAEASKGRDLDALGHRIEATIPGVAATPARDFVQGDNQIRLVKTMAWATSAIAMILGSLGVLNTMMMAVFERTQEIGFSGRSVKLHARAETSAGRSRGAGFIGSGDRFGVGICRCQAISCFRWRASSSPPTCRRSSWGWE